ncbi:PH domain-containing protein [Luteimonas sp. Sa2BVA3]|uniref:PH domain-containing protein n=1 Tax=Luteimonas colneyensis TaxID=2762230 RepID=A0ABR8UK98_9GAMM|nr:PH domain-containing protein [Luteimonas colneyensis]MBD7988228.1 PH domain-containing protein [Luteimonas colneyensis]
MDTQPTDPTPSVDAAPAPGGHERRLHPWSWLFVLLQQLRQFLVPLAVLVFVGGRAEDGYLLWSLVGVAALVAAAVWQYFTYRYRVDEDRLVVRDGLLERNVRQVPFARIHNVTLHQTLLHRAFGVAEVRLESAGGTKPEAEMRVLPMVEAMALERLIRSRGAASAAPGADAGAHGVDIADAGEGRVVLTLPFGELVRLGLASNRGMVVVAGAFALAWQALPDRIMTGLVREYAGQAVGYAGNLVHGAAARVMALAALVVLALALLRLLSVLLALTQYHGFRLLLEGRRVTVERGLLTRLRTSVSRRRIQAWTLHEGLVHRLLGRRSVQVDTVGGSGEDSEQRSLRELAPIATPAACDALVRDVLPGAAWPPVGWRRLHPRAWQRLALPGALLAAIVAAAACWHFGPVGLVALAWLPWSMFAARRHAGHAGYALDERLLAVRGGWWSRYWRFAEIDKIQALRLEQGPLDRAFGMATLWLDTAGAKPTSTPLRLRFIAVAEARALHRRLAADLAGMPLRW